MARNEPTNVTLKDISRTNLEHLLRSIQLEMNEEERFGTHSRELIRANMLSIGGSSLQIKLLLQVLWQLRSLEQKAIKKTGNSGKKHFLNITLLFVEYRNKVEVVQKIREMALSAKAIKDMRMAVNQWRTIAAMQVCLTEMYREFRSLTSAL